MGGRDSEQNDTKHLMITALERTVQEKTSEEAVRASARLTRPQSWC